MTGLIMEQKNDVVNITNKSNDNEHADNSSQNCKKQMSLEFFNRNNRKRGFSKIDNGNDNDIDNKDDNGNGNEKESDNNIIDLTVIKESNVKRNKKQEDMLLKRKLKEEEELKKREFKKLKKLEDDEKRRLKREKDEEEKKLKKQKIENERIRKRELKEKEKLEKQKKRDEELKIREEKKRIEEEKKLKRKEELEKKKIEKTVEREKLELEKQQKRKLEEEKIKKRSIVNFFKPLKSTSSATNTTNNDISNSNGNLNNNNTDNNESSSVDNPNRELVKSDFETYFLPFPIRSNTKLYNKQYEINNDKWDNFFNGSYIDDNSEKSEPQFPDKIRNHHIERSTNVLKCLNSGSINEASKLFPDIPLKYFKFYENKKNPYLGTFSYCLDDVKENINLKVNPFEKITINTINNVENSLVINYDYESDIEDDVEDEGEGDDIKSEEDEEEEDDDDDDDEEGIYSDLDDGFLESEDPNGRNKIKNKNKSKKLIGPLIAVTRHCHEDIDIDNDEFGKYFKSLQWERVRHEIEFPIDPLKDYWSESKIATPVSTPSISSMLSNQKCDTSNSKTDTKLETSATTTTTAGAGAATGAESILTVKKKTITVQEDIDKLRDFVSSHSGLSINTLTELAAHLLDNSYTRAVVKNTLKEHAHRDKTGWVLNKS